MKEETEGGRSTAEGGGDLKDENSCVATTDFKNDDRSLAKQRRYPRFRVMSFRGSNEIAYSS